MIGSRNGTFSVCMEPGKVKRDDMLEDTMTFYKKSI